MKTRIIHGFALILAIVLLFQISGCSIIGVGFGAYEDGSKPDTLFIQDWKIKGVEPGSKINIILNDGNLVSGKYIGLEKVTTEEYTESYARSREQNIKEVILPELGDSITVIDTIGRQWVCEFSGFDYHNFMSVQQKGQTEPSITVLGLVGKILDRDGNVIEVDKIRNLMTEGKLPLLSAIVVQGEVGRIQVPMDKVRQIKVRVDKHNALIGFLIGAVVDSLLVYAVANR
jgi:hypothetical protein